MTSYNLHVEPLALLADEGPHPLADFTVHLRLAVLGGPDQVVLDVVDAVTAPSVVLHAAESTASLLKASPEGEGFSPTPRRGQ